jgi:hypothetical protein
MRNKLSKSAHLSQFENSEAQRRIVLLGASNLSMTLPTVVRIARSLFGGPLEFFAAVGFGRSYGQESKFFGKIFSGILRSDLWDSLDRATPMPTAALVADVGNDLAYEAPVGTIVDWVNTTLDRLAKHKATVALNNVPMASLNTVGAVRYYVMRDLLFARCRLSRAEMLRRAVELSEALARTAEERKIPAFSGENEWYGFDPIHPRRASAHEIWLRMLAALTPPAGDGAAARSEPGDEREVRSLQRRAWLARGGAARGPKAVGRLSDGTTIALF